MHTITLMPGTAGIHYVNSSGVTSIARVGPPCFTVPIIDNDIYDVEGVDFTGTLYTSDPAIQITDDTFHIHVFDNDGMCHDVCSDKCQI